MFLRNCFLRFSYFLAASSILFTLPCATSEHAKTCFVTKKVAGDDRISSTCALDLKTFWTSAAAEDVEDETAVMLKETGLEFIREYDKLSINESIYFHENNYLNLGKFSPVGIVQKFIRNIKGITSDEPYNGEFESWSQEVKEKPDWNSYPFRMKTLSEIEVRIYETLKLYYERKPNLLPYPMLESYFKDMEESSLKALQVSRTYATDRPKNWNPNSHLNEDPHLYIATHPLLIYRMIRRFARDLRPILLHTIAAYEESDGMTLYDKLLDFAMISQVFPNSTDLEETWKSMFRTQNGVNLKTYDFANGKLETVETGFGVTALQALEIGMFHLEERNFDYAIEWVHIATETMKACPLVKKFPVIIKFFKSCLTHAINKYNSMWEAKHNWEWYPGVFNMKVKIPFRPSSYVRMHEIHRFKAATNRQQTKWNPSIVINFIETCSGKNLQSELEKASLKCYSVWKKDPYWHINPLKVEVLNRNPPLYQIHEFIGDKMIEAAKEAAKNNLKRSLVVDRYNPSISIVNNKRTSSQTWIHDSIEIGKFMRPLTYRMEKLTGLIIAPYEAHDSFQVALYGPSHHYEPHIDSYEHPSRCVKKGNRMLTIMGYLSNTEVGGRTAFPVLGTFADPAKGSVVMWYSTKRRNYIERDMRTWHGGCPVVLGTKWIANKWVYSHKNMFIYKCGLNRND